MMMAMMVAVAVREEIEVEEGMVEFVLVTMVVVVMTMVAGSIVFRHVLRLPYAVQTTFAFC